MTINIFKLIFQEQFDVFMYEYLIKYFYVNEFKA